MSTETAPVPSLGPAFRRLVAIAGLGANWDSYGALPPSPRAVAEAGLLIEAVAEDDRARGSSRAHPYHLAPIADGGIQIEWRGERNAIEVQVAPDGTLGYLIAWDRGREAEYDEADVAALEAVRALVARVLVP